MVKVTSQLGLAESSPEFSFGVTVYSEMKIWCVKDMHMLKVVSSKNGVKA